MRHRYSRNAEIEAKEASLREKGNKYIRDLGHLQKAIQFAASERMAAHYARKEQELKAMIRSIEEQLLNLHNIKQEIKRGDETKQKS